MMQQATKSGANSSTRCAVATCTRQPTPSFKAQPQGRRQLMGGLLMGIGTTLVASQPALADDPETVECEYKTASNGLQWCDIIEGTGAQVLSGQAIKANYFGKLQGGKKFDSSFDRGQPLTFIVGRGQVIQGWDIGIVGTYEIPPMKFGGRRKLVIPADLGYGSRGAGRGIIPPNATLEFVVDLVGLR